MKTTRQFSFIAVLLLLLAAAGCQKSPSNDLTGEENLTVQTSPVTTNNHVEAPAPGPTFPLKVTITSKMPSGGVRIDVVARLDGSATTFYTESKSSLTADNNFVIANTPKTVICVVEITVVSNTNSSNKWTGSYRYSSK
ncbi:MAG: hypothetical protein INR73_20390 [Williamsia sp.]|nr:hypothetical protein [Williamsia sp.]